jgi:NADH-quinone oxidoreductase subunit N
MFNFAHLLSPVLIVFVLAVVSMFFAAYQSKSSRLVIIINFGLIIAALISSLLTGVGDSENLSLIWNQLFWTDSLGYLFQTLIIISVFLSIYYSRPHLSTLDSASGDILSLFLLSTMGMMFLVCTNSLMSLYMSLELTSLPLYALVASQRNHLQSVEAAVKFFILGAIASVFILFGISLLYGVSGEFVLPQLVKVLTAQFSQDQAIILLGLIFLIAGASFKLALVPFHNWIPDVYSGANPVMTLFLSAAPKIAGVGMFMRLALCGLFDLHPLVHHILALFALLSIALGNLSALTQKDLRRLLAYSTISHMGYACLGFVAGGHQGNFATLFYITAYSLMTLVAFATVVINKPEHGFLSSLDDLRGLARRSPWIASMLMIVFFSMAGVPPALGFMAKFFIIKSLLNSGYYIFAILALLFAVIGAFYYLNLIRLMFFEVSKDDSQEINVNPLRKTVYITQSILILLVGIFPSALINLCMNIF